MYVTSYKLQVCESPFLSYRTLFMRQSFSVVTHREKKHIVKSTNIFNFWLEKYLSLFEKYRRLTSAKNSHAYVTMEEIRCLSLLQIVNMSLLFNWFQPLISSTKYSVSLSSMCMSIGHTLYVSKSLWPIDILLTRHIMIHSKRLWINKFAHWPVTFFFETRPRKKNVIQLFI